MSISDFMTAYRRVWKAQDSQGFAALFERDGQYWNTPFQVQTGPDELAAYWDRIKLQEDIEMSVRVVSDAGNVGHWNVSYQVASEELFQIWAQSTGTGLPDRKPGDPLPRMELDGLLQAEFAPSGLARTVRIWWHSIPHFA